MTALSTIKIPTKVYVGFQGRRSQDEVPLGFMTPWGEDQAGTKRMSTVDSWAKGYGNNKTFNSVTLDNAPMIGFKIGRAIKRSRSWGGNASYIRIEDPRGFELEISIENLVMAMNGNIVEDGELMAECVWGRDGNRNILLPTNSEPYMASLETKAKVDAVISLRDVKIGDTIKLLTGEEGLYLGSMFPVTGHNSGYYRSGGNVIGVELGKNKRYVMVIDGVVTGFTQVKVSEITKSAASKLTPDEAQKIVSDLVNSGAKLVNSSADYYSTLRGYVVNAKNLTISSKLVPVEEADLIALFTDKELDRGSRYTSVLATSTNGDTLALGLDDNFGNGYQAGRNRPGREYHQNRNASYYYNRTTVKTNGFVGQPATYSQTSSQLSFNGDLTTHIEEKDLASLHRIEITLESNGSQFNFML
jgi:hypothetical protein